MSLKKSGLRTKRKRPSIDVVVFTYNHENFIHKALLSIKRQKVKAHVRVRLHDDSSSDRTVRRAKQILRWTGLRHEFIVAPENRYQSGSQFRVEFIEQCTSEFVAFLDGDDYWTDRLKLQRQLDQFEAFPDSTLCHHLFSGKGAGQQPVPFYPPERFRKPEIPGTELSDHNFIGTCTVMIRRDSFPSPFPKGFNEVRGVDDYPIWALITDGSKICFVDRDMAIYRLHEGQNYANQDVCTKQRQLITAIKWISKSVDPASRGIWEEALSRNNRSPKDCGETEDV